MESFPSALCKKGTNTIYHFMAKENEADIEIPDEENLGDLDESTDWKAKADELQKKHREAGIRNRERTKALKDKIAELEKAPAKKEDKKSDEDLVKRLDAMALKVAGITADDEIELFNKWKDQTGRDADSIAGNKIFQAELADLRTAKANAAATANVKGEGSKSGEKGTPEYWKAKLSKDREGNPVLPDDFPNDPKLLSEVVGSLVASEKGSNKPFYNS